MNELMKQTQTYTIAKYLLQRLHELGIAHMFGVPGDYSLDFLDEVLKSPVHWVGTCNELNAGYAADGYARMKGCGAATVTYGVGALCLLNAVAGAYAEHIPVIIISGAPARHRRSAGALVHHLIADYDTQLDIFKKVTIDAAILNDPLSAPDMIDRVLSKVLTHKLPGYIELPGDMPNIKCRPPVPLTFTSISQSDPDSLHECVAEAAQLLNQAKHPVVLAGAELTRFELGDQALKLVEKLELPFTTMLSSKSVLPEMHPLFIGIYQGAWSRENVRHQVESSDCVLSLGVQMTDLDSGLFSCKLDTRNQIAAGQGEVSIRSHYYQNVYLHDFINELANAVKPRSYLTSRPHKINLIKQQFTPEESRPLSAERFYTRLNLFLNDEMVLLAEPGDAFCAAPEFHIEEARNFIVQCYYSSIGYCTPAALGVSLSEPNKRAVVLSGDGAFQMTAQEVSTMIRLRCPAIILILNNDGYLIERMLHQDGAYNDLQRWNYSMLPEAFGGNDFAIGIKVTTEGELERAFITASENKDKLIFIELVLGKLDCSAGLLRLGKSFHEMAAKTSKPM
ncbi:alpha-keto acid decarboxylase family protein [Candidatus Dependentiae bacterium]|nr:alpha-keto acid decarboxylase family protein [Candidatus Dependentiae bacterium]